VIVAISSNLLSIDAALKFAIYAGVNSFSQPNLRRWFYFTSSGGLMVAAE